MRAAVAAAAGVLALTCAGWLLFATAPGEVALFLVYELLLVLAPGVALYLLISRGARDPLRAAAVGWPLGYVLSIVAFLLGAAAGIEVAAMCAWAIVSIGLVVAAARRLRADPPAAPSRATALALGALCAICVVYAAASLFPQAPLPTAESTPSLNTDLYYDISLVAEAERGLPLEEPTTAGAPLRYHLFPYLDMGSRARITGIDPATIVLRLSPLPMLLLIVLQLFWAGRALGGRLATGVLAAAAVLLLGELDLDGRQVIWFSGYFPSLLWGPFNHGFALGAAFLIPAVVLLHERLADRGRRGDAAALGLLLVGCAGAKGAATLPVLLGGLGLWSLWRLWTARGAALRGRIAAARPALGPLAAVLGLFGLAVLVQYGTNSRLSELDPLQRPFPFKEAEFAIDALPGGGAVDALLSPFLVVLGAAGGMVAIAVGTAVGLLARGAEAPDAVPAIERASRDVWLAGLLLTGLLSPLLFFHPGASTIWPLMYGGIAAAPLAAVGLLRLWGVLRERWAARTLVLAGAGWVAGLALTSYLVYVAAPERALLIDDHWSVLAYAALAGVLPAVVLLARPRRGGPAPALAAVALAALVLATVLDNPIDTVQADAQRLPKVEADAGGMPQALDWVRRNTGDDEAIAITRSADEGSASEAGWSSALSERAVLLGGWFLSGDPSSVPCRKRLNRAIFERADERALRTAREEYRVRWLVVDERETGTSPRVAALGHPRFLAPTVTVYDTGPLPPGAGDGDGPC